MARFRMIKRGFHVGVLDTERALVLELTTPDHKTVIIREIPVKCFLQDGEYKYTKPMTSASEDSIILKRWEAVIFEYRQSVRNNQQWEYNAGGNYHAGKFNCENLAEWVMTGEANTRLGQYARILDNHFGIDVVHGNSRSSTSS